MNKQIKMTVLATSIAISGTASANIFNTIGGWVDSNIVQPVQQTIINPITGVAQSAGTWLTGIYETASETGFAGSPQDREYYEPISLAGRNGQLKIAAMNIKGFPEALQGISNARTGDFARAYVNNQGYDIIGFQENWVRNTALMNAIDANQYPYRSDHFRGGVQSFGDGLSTVSKYPFLNRQRHTRYTDCHGTYAQLIAGTYSSPDCETEKGFTMTQVQVARDFTIHVYNTHMDTYGGSVKQNQLNQLENYIRSVSAGMPVIVIGDFNLAIDNNADAPSPTVKDKWKPESGSMGGLFAGRLGLKWACGEVNYPSTSDRTHKCGGVDHIAYRGNSQFTFNMVRENHVSQSISDHNPYVITLNWTNNSYTTSGYGQLAYAVAFRTAHGGYLAAHGKGGAGAGHNRRGDAETDERLTLVIKNKVGNNPACIQHNDRVSVRTGNGHYFAAHPGGQLEANGPWNLSWETFRLHNHTRPNSECLQNADRVSLQSAHGMYVVAESNSDANANRSAMGAWEIFTLEFIGTRYQAIAGGLKQVSVGADGQAWGIGYGDVGGGNGPIYKYANGYWNRMPGGLSQISVGDANNIWGVQPSGHIYRWNGTGWTLVGGSLSQIAVGYGGETWGVNANDDIFRWNGSTWIHIGGKLNQISVGTAGRIWGTNRSNQAFRWTASGWQHVPGNIDWVEVGEDGTVWAKHNNGIQYRVGNEWRYSSIADDYGTVTSFAVGSSKHMWLTNSAYYNIFNAGGSTY